MSEKGKEPPPIDPNWLVCASCASAIVTASELLEEEVSVLRDAVYAYRLDMLDKEVAVYSATNTADHRFDVVRAKLSDNVRVPTTKGSRLDERESLRLFLRHFQVISLSEQGGSLQSPEQMIAELDRLLEQSNTSEEAEEDAGQESNNSSPDEEAPESPPKRQRTVTETICNRIETRFTEPTDEFTWFTGYSWTIATCMHCHEHLGWVFWKQQSDEAGSPWEQSFLSLIVTRLREKFIPDSPS
jgi:hypothetical protein